MKALLTGYQRFRENTWPHQKKIFEDLAKNGQSPKALVISCVDSRVDPSTIFDSPPGEILTVRNVANLVPPYKIDTDYHGTSAALEFGVKVLKVPHVIVLGHASCGGVKSLLDETTGHKYDFISPWMQIAEPARQLVMTHEPQAERQQCCEEEVIKLSLTNLMTFPWVAERVADGTLALSGYWFEIQSGTLSMLQEDGSFAPVDDPQRYYHFNARTGRI